MNVTTVYTKETTTSGIGLVWITVLAFPAILAYYWRTTHGTLKNGEPPLVPYWLPWLGHGLSFMADINGFVTWVRSLHPASPAATVQIAGQHLYLIFDSALASQIYRQSQTFIFDPYIVMAIGVSGADKNDLEIVERGSQTINPPLPNPENQHFIHNLHQMTPQYLTGKPLDKLTNLFVETLCEDIDARFPPNDPKSYDWETLDLCEFVKTTWAHASITSLFGTNIYRIWPEIQKWLWDFDEHFPSLMTKMPRFVLPQAWALRDEGWEKCAQWEREARAAEATGEFGEDPEWDPYWGMKFVRLRAHYIKDSGMSDKVRAGNQMVFIWGLNANAIPIAMQTIIQLVLHPQIHNAVIQEISEAKTGPTNFDMRKVTSSPRFKSVYIEALRWATASPSPRVVKHDVKVGPYNLRRGNMVIVHSRTLQMDSKTWSVPGVPESDPENFWPERFLSEDDSNTESHSISENAEAEANYSNDVLQAKKQDEERRKMQAQEEKVRTLSLRPFGGGTTLCPGRHFANNEIMGGIAALLLRLEIEVVQEELEKNGVPKPGLKKQGGLLPDRPLIVRMRRKRV